MHEPVKFACWEESIRTNKLLRIRDCYQGEVVTNHRPVRDLLAEAHYDEVRSVRKRNFCLDHKLFLSL